MLCHLYNWDNAWSWLMSCAGHQESDGALYPEKTKTLASYKHPSVLECFARTRHVIVKTVGIDIRALDSSSGGGGWDLSRDTGLTWAHPGTRCRMSPAAVHRGNI